MMFAVINFAGHQYKVKEGDKFVVNRLEAKEGDKVTVKQVLMAFKDEGKDAKVGQPFVAGAAVELKVLAHRLGEKKRVFKMKPKKRNMSNRGHRQHETVVEVTKVKA